MQVKDHTLQLIKYIHLIVCGGHNLETISTNKGHTMHQNSNSMCISLHTGHMSKCIYMLNIMYSITIIYPAATFTKYTIEYFFTAYSYRNMYSTVHAGHVEKTCFIFIPENPHLIQIFL